MGGVETLSKLVASLPGDFKAPLLVVMHTSAHGPGLLPQILGRAGRLPAKHAEEGDRIAPGNIYVAPPDQHLLVKDGHLRLSRGPTINRSRPSVDVLFQSAAEAYGPQVIGVVLTGSLSDGVAGLEEIRARGGTTIVQDPADASCPEMPLNAIRAMSIDYTVPLAEIPALLAELVARAPQQKARGQKRRAAKAEQKRKFDLICPDCGGPLHEVTENKIVQFRCRVGHTYSTESLLSAHAEGLERSLWAAVQLLEERADLLRRVASRLPGPAERSKRDFEAKARHCEEHSAALRKIVEAT